MRRCITTSASAIKKKYHNAKAKPDTTKTYISKRNIVSTIVCFHHRHLFPPSFVSTIVCFHHRLFSKQCFLTNQYLESRLIHGVNRTLRRLGSGFSFTIPVLTTRFACASVVCNQIQLIFLKASVRSLMDRNAGSMRCARLRLMELGSSGNTQAFP